MAISIKATAEASPGSLSLTIPATVSVGDLLLVGAGSYNNTFTFPSGFTQILSATTTATYTDFLIVGYRIAQAGDAGSSMTMSGGQGGFSGISMVVITGHDPTNPIHQSSTTNTGGAGTVCGTNSMVTTKAVRRFAFISEMSNSSTASVFSAPGGVTQQSAIYGQSGYHTYGAYSKDVEEAPGTLGSIVFSGNQTGAIEGIAVGVAVANAAPAITSTSPTTFADNRTSPVRISWNYTDAESNTQYKYEVGYRVQGTSTWTTVTNTTSNAYYDIPTATLTLGNTYEYQVRIDDNQGGGWSSYATGSFVAGTSAWTNGSQVTSSTQSTTIDTTGLAPGTYYVQVRTADAVDFGPWSANQTFVVTPLGNVWVRTGGTWVQMKNNVKVAGTFKQVPPTKKNTAGTFN